MRSYSDAALSGRAPLGPDLDQQNRTASTNIISIAQVCKLTGLKRSYINQLQAEDPETAFGMTSTLWFCRGSGAL